MNSNDIILPSSTYALAVLDFFSNDVIAPTTDVYCISRDGRL